MLIEQALPHARDGAKIARKGWNGKNMFVFLVAGSTFEVSRAPLNRMYPLGTSVTYHPHFDMQGADGKIGPWIPSVVDMHVDDWFIV